MRGIKGTAEVATSIKDDGTQFSLTIDRAKASQVGLSPAAVAGTLRTAVSGVVATTIKKDNEDIDVLVSTNLNPEWQEPSDYDRWKNSQAFKESHQSADMKEFANSTTRIFSGASYITTYIAKVDD